MATSAEIKKMKDNGIDDNFEHDPEGEDNVKKYRLPFALCKAHGIAIQDWWTPKDAWAALKHDGAVDDVSEEYKEFYRNMKKEKSKQYRERAKFKKEQLKSAEHNPDKSYVHQEGKIDGVEAGNPMTFEEADSGKVNPYYGSKYIGYRHNCQTCVATYIARLKGYNVHALPNLNNKEIYYLSMDTSLAYTTENGKHPEKIKKPSGKGNVNFINETMKPGEIFSVEFNWKGRRSGHIITAEKLQDGNIRFYDPQTNSQFSSKEAISYFSMTNSLELMNLTNVKIDENYADKIMKKS